MSSSSSSSLEYSSSSSSSYKESKNKQTACLAYDGKYIYAGTGDRGILLRSINGFFWEEFYMVNDLCVSALLVQDNKLYIGTFPDGYIYITDLTTNTTTFSQILGSGISCFCYYNNDIFVSTSNPSNIYKYNKITKIWDYFYKPYGTEVRDMIVFKDKMVVLTDTNQILGYNGTNFELFKML